MQCTLLEAMLDEATLKDLARKQRSVTRLFPTFYKRVKKVSDKGGLRFMNMEEGKWTFAVHSGTKDRLWYNVEIRFLNINDVLERAVSNLRLWKKDRSGVDMRKLAGPVLFNTELQMACNDPSDLYWGYQYIRSKPKYNAMAGDKEDRPPRVRNPRQLGAYCKHIQAVVNQLPLYEGTFAKFLTKYYKETIERFEVATRKRTSQVKAAAQALGQRAAEKPEQFTRKAPEAETGTEEEGE